MKTKRINAITRTLGVLAEVLSRKEQRIYRGIDQAAAAALDYEADAREQAMNIINGLGDVAGAGDTEALKETLNNYVAKVDEADNWAKVAKIIGGLKDILNEEVEVEEEKK